MNNILKQPYTTEQYAKFASVANQNGQRTEIENEIVYRLFEYENVENGEIVDISDTEDYKEEQLQKEKESTRQKLTEEINEMDKKRIRALCEPEIKDPQSGLTWLEYYNTQVAELREQLNLLN